jgi:hypothetical protein
MRVAKILNVIILNLFLMVPIFAHGEEIQLSADEAYSKSLRILVDLGAIPTFKDKDLMVIKTDPLPIQMTTEECDCGKMFGIPYMKDKRVKTAITYQIIIKKIEEQKSSIEVKITIDGYMDVSENAPFFVDKTRDKNKVLTCKSKGVLEKKFIDTLTN